MWRWCATMAVLLRIAGSDGGHAVTGMLRFAGFVIVVLVVVLIASGAI